MRENHNKARAGEAGRLRLLANELLGAIDDHRKWISSDRARALATTFEVSGRLATYAVYIALAYLAFNSFQDIRNGLITGTYAIPEHVDGSRAALFTVFAAAVVGPIAIIAVGIGIGWIYNLTTATAHRYLPRFVQPLVHPSILLAVAVAYAAFHPVVSATAAKGYLIARANIEAASPQETVAIKVIEIPSVEVPAVAEAAAQDTPSERELVRLRSMFHSGQSCLKEAQETELKPQQSETGRPEPGLASGPDCQTGKSAPHE